MIRLFFIVFLALSGLKGLAQTFTWTGTTSSDWATGTNWSPNGIPTTGDDVILNNASVPNTCILDGNRTIDVLTITAGTLNLNGFILTLAGISTISNGIVQTGTLSVSNLDQLSTSTLTSVTVIKTGGGNDNWDGGNTFNTVTIINQDDSRIRMAVTTGDTFTGPTSFSNTNISSIQIAYSGSSSFASSVTIDNSSTGTISFGTGGGTSTIASGGAVLTNGFATGNIDLDGVTQNGTAANGSFSPATSFGAVNSTFGGSITVTTASLILTNSTFSATNSFTFATGNVSGSSFSTASGSTSFTKTAGGNVGWAGGNTFGPVSITNQTDLGRLRLAATNGDTFSTTSTFTNSNTNALQISYAGTSTFGGAITLTNSSTGEISFGANGGTSTLTSGSLQNGGFTTGILNIAGFTQSSTTANAAFDIPDLTVSGSVFNGNITLTSADLTITNSSLNATNVISGVETAISGSSFSTGGGTTSITKTAGGADNWAGGNTFGPTTITNESSTGALRISNTNGDTFLSTVSFVKTGTSNFQVTYLGSTSFAGVVTLTNTNTGVLSFGLGGGSASMSAGNLTTSSFSAGTLTIQNFTQNSTTANTLNAPVLTITASTFNGQVDATTTTMNLTSSAFTATNNLTSADINTVTNCQFSTTSGTTTFTKTGGNDDTWSGGNTFGNVIVENESTTRIRMADALADDFNGSATFIQSNSGPMEPCYNFESTFSGTISTAGTATAITFGGGTGGIIIDGSGGQSFSGDLAFPPSTERLTMSTSSSGTLTLNVPLNITVSLTLTSGYITTTTSNVLTLTNETVTTTIGSGSSFVDGPFAYQMTSNLVARSTLNFPIGKGGLWRPVVLQVGHTVNTSYTYVAEVFNASAQGLGWTLPATVDTVSYFRYWNVNRYLTADMSSAPTAGLRVTAGNEPIITLHFDWQDNVRDGTNLSVVKNTNSNPTEWIDIGGTGGPAPNAGQDLTGTITSTSSPSAFDSFSRFTLGSGLLGTNKLPVDLLYFKGEMKPHTVLLEWATATEIDNEYFLLEKSLNGTEWEAVAQLAGAGDSKSKLEYSTLDSNPYKGLSYYRLTQVDFDGDKEVFNPIALFNQSDDSRFMLYPNPASDYLYVGDATEIEVFSLEGINVTGTIPAERSGNGWILDVRLLPGGLYTVTSGSHSRLIFID